ncbi:MAG TPA: GNAT family N-acetyltransferase [Thermomicrobiales bacterium]|jgi:ribosomal protein S18 acetylase RimI-like enzyme|nr:GNAT family N-acetyltransferase [Thermomicrobiales bacterium]
MATPAEIVLREARAADAVALANLFLLARRTAMPWLAVVHGDADTHAWMAARVVPSGELVVADVDGRVAGFAAVGGGWLHDLYVHPDWQRRGVGAALLAEAKRRSPAGLQCWVFQRNARARRFYEARGFRLVEETNGEANEEREPDARYRWAPDDLIR